MRTIANRSANGFVFTITLLVKSPPGFYIGNEPEFQSAVFSLTGRIHKNIIPEDGNVGRVGMI
jgi:hypothetical protein